MWCVGPDLHDGVGFFSLLPLLCFGLCHFMCVFFSFWPILDIFPFTPAKQECTPKLWNLLVKSPIYFCFGDFYANAGGV